jgi:hypothetical protein
MIITTSQHIMAVACVCEASSTRGQATLVDEFGRDFYFVHAEVTQGPGSASPALDPPFFGTINCNKKSDIRGAVTYVAVICNMMLLQPFLPHFLIGNKARFTNAIMAEIAAIQPRNIHVWREASAWNNHLVMMRILDALAKALAPWKQVFNPVLILDVAPCHIHKDVMQKASRLGIRLVFIPAKLTPLLQPLDTHCFGAFKQWLRVNYQKLRNRSPQQVASIVDWAQLLMQAPSLFFSTRKWQPAFKSTGADGSTQPLTTKLRHYMGTEKRPVSEAVPTDADLACVWPKRRRMEYAHHFLFPPPKKLVQASSAAARSALARVVVQLPLRDLN